MSAGNMQLKGVAPFGGRLPTMPGAGMPRTTLSDSALADDAALEILVQVGADNDVHARALGLCRLDAGGGACTLQCFTGPTFDPAGTAAAPVAQDRRGTPETVAATVTTGPTVSDAGTELHLSAGEEMSLVLERGTDYLFRLTNLAGGAALGLLAVELRDS